jgi:hypothetical protein
LWRPPLFRSAGEIFCTSDLHKTSPCDLYRTTVDQKLHRMIPSGVGRSAGSCQGCSCSLNFHAPSTTLMRHGGIIKHVKTQSCISYIAAWLSRCASISCQPGFAVQETATRLRTEHGSPQRFQRMFLNGCCFVAHLTTCLPLLDATLYFVRPHIGGR